MPRTLFYTAQTLLARISPDANHHTMEENKTTAMLDAKEIDDSCKAASPEPIIIYADSDVEKAALRKFDKVLITMAFVFLLLSSLDRSNVRLGPVSPHHALSKAANC